MMVGNLQQLDEAVYCFVAKDASRHHFEEARAQSLKDKS